MALNTFTPNDKLKKDLINENFDGLVNGSEMHYAGAWNSFKVDFWTTGSTAVPTISNGTLAGRYFRLGRFVAVRIFLRFATGDTIPAVTDNWGFTLPFRPSLDDYNSTNGAGGGASGLVYIEDKSTNAYFGHCSIVDEVPAIRIFLWVATGSLVTLSGVNYNTPFTFGNGDFITVQFFYETEESMV